MMITRSISLLGKSLSIEKDFLVMKNTTPVSLSVCLFLASMPIMLIGFIVSPARAADNTSKMQKVEQRFRAADKNRDGYLTKAEAKVGMPRISPYFTQIDTDKSGKLSLDEVRTAITSRG